MAVGRGRPIGWQGPREVDCKYGPAVQRGEGLPLELDRHHHNRSLGPPMDLVTRLAVAADGDDFRFFEDADVELRRLFSLMIEPQAGRNSLNLCHFGFL